MEGGSGIVACEGGRRERPGGCDPSSCVTRCEAYLTRSTLLSLLGIALYAAEFSRHLHTCRSCSLPSPHPAHHTRFRHITNPRTHPLGRVTHLRFKQLFHRSCSNDYIANALLRLSVNRGFSRILAREPIKSLSHARARACAHRRHRRQAGLDGALQLAIVLAGSCPPSYIH